ncbi:hypothetical protein [Halochromatium salexigens]|uniref:Uncharacterized protein n=1 Tax=Halochromatium salexigens TaxID=49447 RepID=A0AAJ0UIP1_HALSE|nr:hypothetical protein [Halochromatium salexigens]MBK5932214.1 hypothetical protein [Halochromatium salexigens]
MFDRSSMRPGEWLVYVSVVFLFATALGLELVAPERLETVYLAEDGVLEWLIVIIFAFLAGLCFWRALQLRRMRSGAFVGVSVLLGLAFIFGIGEELSWGQRIFGIETPGPLKRYNKQQELNIHNLKVGRINFNQLIFGWLLFLGLALYLLVLPWLADRYAQVRAWVDHLGLPLATRLQALAFVPVLILPQQLLASKESDELAEVCGALLLVAVFCYARNRSIYSPMPGAGIGSRSTASRAVAQTAPLDQPYRGWPPR